MEKSTLDAQGLERYVTNLRPEFEHALARLVEIPTVSMDPERRGAMRAGAEAACELLRAIGAEARTIDTPGHPLVFGKIIQNPAYPTLTLYNHIDVQPADREKEGWRHDPFRFVNDGGKYSGRGTTDDKGPALTAYYGIRYALQQKIPLNF
jgi:acetylornithine deacetylase/succinyl-diaminopimelate desuccinylase-like protein